MTTNVVYDYFSHGFSSTHWFLSWLDILYMDVLLFWRVIWHSARSRNPPIASPYMYSLIGVPRFVVHQKYVCIFESKCATCHHHVDWDHVNFYVETTLEHSRCWTEKKKDEVLYQYSALWQRTYSQRTYPLVPRSSIFFSQTSFVACLSFLTFNYQ